MLAQIPTLQDLAGIAFVIIAIAIHKPPGSAAEGQSLSDNAAPVREKVK
jgi:inner membrane transporter RhtA